MTPLLVLNRASLSLHLNCGECFLTAVPARTIVQIGQPIYQWTKTARSSGLELLVGEGSTDGLESPGGPDGYDSVGGGRLARGGSRLEVEGISKAFPGVQALDEVSLEVQPGEVHAIVGENGAGKSTLMRLIAGVEAPDKGKLLLDGESMQGIDEYQAGKLGIGMVHQERSLVPSLSVAENVFAGRQPTRSFGSIDWEGMRRRTREILGELRVDIDPRRLVSNLPSAQQQMVEIAKALSQRLRLLILDEPSAALTVGETKHLFNVVRRLTEQDVSVVYISHRLGEVFEIAERVTVLKDGKLVGTHPTSSVTEDDLIQLMVGRELSVVADNNRGPGPDASVAMEVENLASSSSLTNASLQVHSGEIVCLAGLIGAGRTELCEAVFGVRSRAAGRISINGKDLEIRSPADAMRAGIGMVPEDRAEAGLFLEMSITENIVATNQQTVTTRGFLSRGRSEQLAASYVERLRIATTSVRQRLENLSGGNQQKVLLAKWLARKPNILIVDEPTRGVDVGARADIYEVLRELAGSGIALLVVSSDLPEVLALAH